MSRCLIHGWMRNVLIFLIYTTLIWAVKAGFNLGLDPDFGKLANLTTRIHECVFERECEIVPPRVYYLPISGGDQYGQTPE